MNGWEIINHLLKNNPTHTFCRSFASFLKALLLIFNKNTPLFVEWLQDMENIGLFESLCNVKKSSEFAKIIDHIEEHRKFQIHGINMKIISTLSVEENKTQKGQIDSIMNQLNDDNFLTTENPFFDINQLQVLQKIGKGTFGIVYKAKSKETNDILAVKVSMFEVDEDTRYSDQTLSIFREINLMSSFNYPTILKFIGYSPTDFEGQFYPTIIMEFCESKTLRDVINDENKGLASKLWDETRKLINIYGIAAGMKYLHEQNIIHRDLKTENILMDNSMCPKIADFGLSKMTIESDKSSSMNKQSILKLNGTPLYMAPEILKGEPCSMKGEPCSMKGDVYAFSIIVYEIVTGKTPFNNLESIYQIIEKVCNGNRPKLTDDIPEHYCKLIQDCWSQSPLERPTFEKIVEDLKNNQSFITESVDETTYLDFIDFLDNYQSTFNLYKKHIIFEDFIKGKHPDMGLKKVSET